MKKTYLNIIAIGTLALGIGTSITSCSDSFLDVESATESNSGTFYKTENDAYRALIACYEGWRRTTSEQGLAFYLASEVMSDECLGGTGISDTRTYQVVDRFDISQETSSLNIFTSEWTNYYKGIYRCNVLLQHEGDIAWNADKNLEGLYMGQCRAIRAFLYFDMVRLWGNIPLLTEPSDENVPQADPKDVYSLIISDLKYAAENIPADAYPKSAIATNDGFISRYAAEAMLGRVYLYYSGYYGEEPANLTKSEALTYLEDIISSGEYALVPDFKNLWPAASSVSSTNTNPYSWNADLTTYTGTLAGDYAANSNTESVLVMKFNNTFVYGNGEDSRDNEGNRWLVMMGIRNVNSSPYGMGWGACTVPENFVKNFSNNDSRLSASIIDLEGEGIENIEDFAKNSINDQREYTGYTVKKYTPMSFFDGTSATKADGSGDFQTAQFQDFMVIRYADVLLMAAELGSNNAQTYFNMVRQRAYGTAYTEKAVTKDNIMEERKLEFAFEGLRYWDLLRQGVTTAANTIAQSYNVLSGGNEDKVIITADHIIATQGLSQIPNTQVTLSNGVLIQNPGWK